MTIKPTGFYVLVELASVDQEVKEGPLKGMVLTSNAEHNREQTGHDCALVLAIGPTAHLGYDGIDGASPEERAQQWGYNVGDTVQMDRYQGTEIKVPGYENQRLVLDCSIKGVYLED
jgi:co-chaperonin GroES (HSP10)